MSRRIPKVSRIAEIPTVYKKTKVNKSVKEANRTVAQTARLQKKYEAQHNVLGRLIYEKLYFMNVGSYKGYKYAKINYAKYASENFEAVKSMPKEKVPKMSISLFSPLLPFYAIRFARILITDMFRKKTPAEKKLAQLVHQEKAKIKLNQNA